MTAFGTKASLYEIRFLPTPLFFMMKFFLSNRFYVIRCEDKFSQIQYIKVGVSQGSILDPPLYGKSTLFPFDIPHSNNTTLDLLPTLIIQIYLIINNIDLTIASTILQTHLMKL